jgi:hypothetical protein
MTNRRQELFDQAAELGIRIRLAKKVKDANRIAIHLLNPDLDMLEDALHTAERDNFPEIVIHSAATFAKTEN